MSRFFVLFGLLWLIGGCASVSQPEHALSEFREGHAMRQQFEFVRTLERHNQVFPIVRLDQLPH
ncbi:hypothetical protein C942_04299 [Photobacterium marinum]|uniref:Lipoprotein n=1 Tax=Photobacterium marinum TaxID=1056511 RepID=L8JCN8_9GAMM|nr:hypothetical protein [Photobacterium marinum]ELR66601.1 hypothetical protein C942_04299 [Photobacterium marinum]